MMNVLIGGDVAKFGLFWIGDFLKDKRVVVYFLIRNEKDYINKRTNTEENKETKEREKKPREG